MSMPTYLGAGTPGHVAAQNSPFTPTYPAGLSAGDLCFMSIACQDAASLNAAVILAPNSTDGWELVANEKRLFMQAYVYGKICDGTESGLSTSAGFTTTSTGTQLEGVIYAFTGMTTTSTTVAGLLESTATISEATGTYIVTAPTVTTVGPSRLAVAACFQDNNVARPAFPDFSGETGGTWASVLSATEFVTRPHLFVQTAGLASSGSTITGGTTWCSTTTNGTSICFGLALIGASTASSVGSPVFPGSVFSSPLFGQGVVF